MPVANSRAKNALGNSLAIAVIRAGLEVGALGAKSTEVDCKILGSAFNPINWTEPEIANAPVSFSLTSP
jgi:hypothetical protein